MSLATKSLKISSIEAARLWQELNSATEESQIDGLLESIWQAQSNQETSVDIYADLSDQIDAEIVAVKARIDHLTKIHKAAIDKLETWRDRLDRTVISLNERGAIANELVGKQRRIAIKDNPPSCEILVDPEDLPDQYQTKQIKISANKKAIVTAWKQGTPVEGTNVYRKRRVTYGLIKSNSLENFPN